MEIEKIAERVRRELIGLHKIGLIGVFFPRDPKIQPRNQNPMKK
jgi:hypothetical protein